MKVLIPLLSEGEDEEFLMKASEGAKEILLLLVVDTQPNQRFGFTTAQITKGRKLMENARNFLSKKKKIEEIIEWGDTQAKIVNVALLNKVDKAIVKGQNNQIFDELLERLRKENITVEVI